MRRGTESYGGMMEETRLHAHAHHSTLCIRPFIMSYRWRQCHTKSSSCGRGEKGKLESLIAIAPCKLILDCLAPVQSACNGCTPRYATAASRLTSWHWVVKRWHWRASSDSLGLFDQVLVLVVKSWCCETTYLFCDYCHWPWPGLR